MFIDTAVITVRAGRGGDGSVSFRREKYVPAGGPDGGDGGRGGHIWLRADDKLSNLSDYRYKTKYAAGDGGRGGAKLCAGRGGEDLALRVPVGTLIYDDDSGRLLADMSGGDPFLLCKGGRGGWGNKHFANASRQAPRFAKSGLEGESLRIRLEVKLLADVGLVGFPNAGKSTLLSSISAARPKIANYPFTTLTPHLGVVYLDADTSFLCADIPGLIEGAAAGAGLGHAFLRHIERCRLLLHIVDAAGTEGRDPCADVDAIDAELAAHSPELAQREQIVVANKCDVIADETALNRLREHVAPRALLAVSAATSDGLRTLTARCAERLAALPPIRIFQPDPEPEFSTGDTEPVTEIMQADGVWTVSGDWLQRVMRDVNFDDLESLAWFEQRLQANGVYDKLEAMGVAEGDTVEIYGLSFEYVR